MVAEVGGITLLTKKNKASSGLNEIRFRIKKQNCPTVKSEGTKYFFLSRSPIRALGAFSTMTGTRSGYFRRIFSPSERRFSKGCSSLYCHFSVKLTNAQKLSYSFARQQATRFLHKLENSHKIIENAKSLKFIENSSKCLKIKIYSRFFC